MVTARNFVYVFSQLPYGIDAVRVTSTAGLSQIYFKMLKYYPNPYHAYNYYRHGVIDSHVYAAFTSENRKFAVLEICNR